VIEGRSAGNRKPIRKFGSKPIETEVSQGDNAKAATSRRTPNSTFDLVEA